MKTHKFAIDDILLDKRGYNFKVIYIIKHNSLYPIITIGPNNSIRSFTLNGLVNKNCKSSKDLVMPKFFKQGDLVISKENTIILVTKTITNNETYSFKGTVLSAKIQKVGQYSDAWDLSSFTLLKP